MDSNSNNIFKIFNNLKSSTLYSLVNRSNKDITEDITEVSLFKDENGEINKELLTKEGFINLVFGNANEKMKDMYGDLYDAIAKMDGDSNMSEEELKFFASIGENPNVINKSNFYALGVIDRNIDKHIKRNVGLSAELLLKPEINISSPARTDEPETVTKENEELGINGKIDEPVIQGTVGDCWLLAGINSLNSTEQGKQIIRNAIIPNEDGTITVNFAGVGKQITLTPEEIREHDTDMDFYDNYSNGDNDALVLEMAMQKLIKNNPTLFVGLDKGINGGEIFNFWDAIVPNHNIMHIQNTGNSNEENINGTMVSSSGPSAEYSDKVKQVLRQAMDNPNIAMGFTTGVHAMAVTDVKENQVTIIDSMNYATQTMSWDSFINGLSSFTYTDLSKR